LSSHNATLILPAYGVLKSDAGVINYSDVLRISCILRATMNILGPHYSFILYDNAYALPLLVINYTILTYVCGG